MGQCLIVNVMIVDSIPTRRNDYFQIVYFFLVLARHGSVDFDAQYTMSRKKIGKYETYGLDINSSWPALICGIGIENTVLIHANYLFTLFKETTTGKW